MADNTSRVDASHAAQQAQFLDVIDRDEAERRFHAHLRLAPLGREQIVLDAALGRTLADDVIAPVDVPGFDRANVDGFALVAADTFGATEIAPRYVALSDEVIPPGVVPGTAVIRGTATTIATGGVVPRGADAVLMVEHTEVVDPTDLPDGFEPIPPPGVTAQFVRITRAASPGEHVTFAGTDIARGETVLRAGQRLTSREIGVLAAMGVARVAVWRRPRVAILSTGDELVAPGAVAGPAGVFDSNAAILASAVRELGGEPVLLGIVPDDLDRLKPAVAAGLRHDVLLLSGGTSKGAGDLSYRVVSEWRDPGIVAHGVALKPGKPVCLAVTQGKPVAILPGFPTSAIFTFHEFVAPVIRALAGIAAPQPQSVEATLPVRVNSERGRTEYLLVNLVCQTEVGGGSAGAAAYYAFPMGKGSGSVTTFSGADGFITIDQHCELLEAESPVRVQLLGQHLTPADLVVIGSHCVGLDYLLGELQQQGIPVKALHVGSTGGLVAARKGQCDLAGIHLMDSATGEYNRPFLDDTLELISGYRRMQGLVYRLGDPRFEGSSLEAAISAALADPSCCMVNRNAGSGTRILIDRLLESHGRDPRQVPGYAVQVKSHNAVAAAVNQRRADWGLAIDSVARLYGLAFLPYCEEHYDFVVPRARADRAAVRAFRELLTRAEVQQRLTELGFHL